MHMHHTHDLHAYVLALPFFLKLMRTNEKSIFNCNGQKPKPAEKSAPSQKESVLVHF